VDGVGNVITFNDKTWASPSAIDEVGLGLFSVFCLTKRFCAAVDGSGNALTFNGKLWSAPAPIDGTGGGFTSVSCQSLIRCVAVDKDGNALTFNARGRTLPRLIDRNKDLRSVSCASAYCAAIDGSGHGLIYNGASWTSPALVDSNGGLTTVSCAPSAFCVAAGGGYVISRLPPPSVNVTAMPQHFQLSSSIVVTYSASDAFSPVASFDVRYRVAPWNGGFGKYVYPSGWQKTTRRSERIPALPGREYCVSIRARDKANRLSPWSADNCTERPLNDRALAATTPGWARRSGAGYYLGSYTSTSRYNAELRITGARLDRMAIVVTRCATCGEVAIYVNGGYWRTVRTYASKTTHQVILVQPAFALRKATIILKDVTKGKRLIVEGLGVSLS